MRIGLEVCFRRKSRVAFTVSTWVALSWLLSETRLGLMRIFFLLCRLVVTSFSIRSRALVMVW